MQTYTADFCPRGNESVLNVDGRVTERLEQVTSREVVEFEPLFVVELTT